MFLSCKCASHAKNDGLSLVSMHLDVVICLKFNIRALHNVFHGRAGHTSERVTKTPKRVNLSVVNNATTNTS